MKVAVSAISALAALAVAAAACSPFESSDESVPAPTGADADAGADAAPPSEGGPDGGVPSAPGSISCGASTCSAGQKCCVGVNACVGEGEACPRLGSIAELACDDATDCVAGEVCCLDTRATSTERRALCAKTCTTDQLELCRTDVTDRRCPTCARYTCTLVNNSFDIDACASGNIGPTTCLAKQ